MNQRPHFQGPRGQGGRPIQTKRRKRKIKMGRIAVISIVAIVLLLVVGYAVINAIVDHYLGKINIVTSPETGLVFETGRIVDTEEPFTVPPPPPESGDVGTVIPGTEPSTEPSTGELQPPPPETFDTPPEYPVSASDLPLICDTKEVTNILLIATDARWDEAGRSDTMILLSINARTKKIVLCSFMRDIWALFPTHIQSPVAGEYDKLTHAHAYGGPELTMAVFKETFNIDIQYYVKVKFTSFVDVVDALGGLQLNLTKEEAEYVNQVCWDPEISALFPSYDRSPLEERDGVQTLNGPQALCHVRNRTIGWDWARTQRQRTAIAQMINQAKGLSFTKLDQLASTVLPLITTNMPKSMLKDMIGKAFNYLKFDVESTRFPQNYDFTESYEGTYHILPDMEKNCAALYKRIYGAEPPKNSAQ